MDGRPAGVLSEPRWPGSGTDNNNKQTSQHASKPSGSRDSWMCGRRIGDGGRQGGRNNNNKNNGDDNNDNNNDSSGGHLVSIISISILVNGKSAVRAES